MIEIDEEELIDYIQKRYSQEYDSLFVPSKEEISKVLNYEMEFLEYKNLIEEE